MNRRSKKKEVEVTTEQVHLHTLATVKEAVERMMKQDAALTVDDACKAVWEALSKQGDALAQAGLENVDSVISLIDKDKG